MSRYGHGDQNSCVIAQAETEDPGLSLNRAPGPKGVEAASDEAGHSCEGVLVHLELW